MDIPLDKLMLALKTVIRSHKYNCVPSLGEIHEMAKDIAGLGRSQWNPDACRDVPGPREWPGFGLRYTGIKGETEPIERGVPLALAAGEARLLLTSGDEE